MSNINQTQCKNSIFQQLLYTKAESIDTGEKTLENIFSRTYGI